MSVKIIVENILFSISVYTTVREKKKFVKNTLIPEYKRKRLYLNIKGKACTGIKGGNTEF